MIIHDAQFFLIYFQGTQDALNREIFFTSPESKLSLYEPIRDIKKLLCAESLITCKQVHSDQGLLVSSDYLTAFKNELSQGDYLITALPEVGLGVYTADCLPIVFYDQGSHSVGICHAGWMGSVQEVAIKTVQAMQQNFKTRLEDLTVVFGPCARACCYEVTAEFEQNIKNFDYSKSALFYRDKKLFFDLALFNQLQLEAHGIKKASFTFYTTCTICNPEFCSYRREKEQASRQLTAVAVKK